MALDKLLYLVCPECGHQDTFWNTEKEQWKCVNCLHEWKEKDVTGQCVNCAYVLEPAHPDEGNPMNGVDCSCKEHISKLGERSKKFAETHGSVILMRYEIIMTNHDGSVMKCPEWELAENGMDQYISRGNRAEMLIKMGGWQQKMLLAGMKYDYIHMSNDGITFHAFFQEYPSKAQLKKLKLALRASGKGEIERDEIQELRPK